MFPNNCKSIVIFEDTQTSLACNSEKNNSKIAHEYEALVEWYWQWKTEALCKKPAPLSFCPSSVSDWRETKSRPVKRQVGEQLSVWSLAFI
jgi:hypothetical protein